MSNSIFDSTVEIHNCSFCSHEQLFPDLGLARLQSRKYEFSWQSPNNFRSQEISQLGKGWIHPAWSIWQAKHPTFPKHSRNPSFNFYKISSWVLCWQPVLYHNHPLSMQYTGATIDHPASFINCSCTRSVMIYIVIFVLLHLKYQFFPLRH